MYPIHPPHSGKPKPAKMDDFLEKKSQTAQINLATKGLELNSLEGRILNNRHCLMAISMSSMLKSHGCRNQNLFSPVLYLHFQDFYAPSNESPKTLHS